MSADADRASPLERLAVNAVLVLAVIYALYPVLWVISLAFSKGSTPELRALPIPRYRELSLDNFRLVTGWGDPARSWLFVRQLGNSLIVSLATAAAAILIATPTAYALARHEFVGKSAGLRTLLLTQMFPGVASAVPLYLILDALHLLDTRSGLVLVYAATAVPFAIFQLRGAFLAIPVDLEEAAMVAGRAAGKATFRKACVRVRRSPSPRSSRS
jgi:arabinogalactan oligomer / maltooligosaccharide transport system permease protein